MPLELMLTLVNCKLETFQRSLGHIGVMLTNILLILTQSWKGFAHPWAYHVHASENKIEKLNTRVRFPESRNSWEHSQKAER